MRWNIATLILGVSVAHGAMAQQVGDVLENRVPIMDARGSSVYASVPLPPGKWEVSDTNVRKSNGNTAADLRDVRLLQIEDGRLRHAIEITMKVNGVNMQWNDEPCKKEPTLAKNNYGTALFKQKCLSLHAITFLQNNNAATRDALASLAARGVKHDYNSLVLHYQRFGDFGNFLIVQQHFFPSIYGLENLTVGVINESPWHPSRVGLDASRKAFVDAVFRYGEIIASSYDEAYMQKESAPLPAFTGR